MPTLRDIRDTAFNLRPQFEPSVNQKAEWEKQYGPPRPFESVRASDSFKVPAERECDRLAREVMQVLAREGVRDVQRVSWGRWWQIAKALGFSMNVFQQREIDAYEEANPHMKGWKPPAVPKVTQADIDAAVAQRNAAKAQESAEDPNRWE